MTQLFLLSQEMSIENLRALLAEARLKRNTLQKAWNASQKECETLRHKLVKARASLRKEYEKTG